LKPASPGLEAARNFRGVEEVELNAVCKF
jgi:hypothetical protein